jgi:hypothetical protein
VLGLVLFQMINVSFNYVNLYHSGKSGFRHKIALNSNEIDSLCEFVSETLLHIDYPESNEDEDNVFLENFDLGFFDNPVAISSPPVKVVESFHGYHSASFPTTYFDLHSPPPKLA